MGRPQALTEDKRQKLLAEGYRPVEVWVLDTSNPKVLEELLEEARQIAEADRRENMDKVLDAFAAEVVASIPDDEGEAWLLRDVAHQHVDEACLIPSKTSSGEHR